MDTASQLTAQFVLRLQRFIVSVWFTLRSPKLTGALLLALAIVLLLRLLLPQQSKAPAAPAVWIDSLPPLLQPWGELLYALGFSQLFQSVWFWVLIALLLLNSLIALADYARPSWRRIREASEPGSIMWQHPLAYRTERSVRLPEAVDPFLNRLKETLLARGFSTAASVDENSRMVTAARWRWVWLGIVTFYSGLILFCLAILISQQTLENEQITLFPRELNSSPLFNGSLELSEVDAEKFSGAVRVITQGGDASTTKVLFWRLFRPAFLGDLLFLPVAIEPVLTVEARGSSGELLRLMPLREDLSPAARLNLPLDQPDEPLYFLIPSASLAFQISPVSTSTESSYNVQVRRGSESAPSENLMVGPGEIFELDALSVTISPSYGVTFDARRDPALPLYVASLVIIAASALLLIFLSPWQVWLVPEVKGRGGQLYAVAEKFGFDRRATTEFLEQLLEEDES